MRLVDELERLDATIRSVTNGSLRKTRIHGRAGNLLVIQQRSANGIGEAKQATLRSLGLKGIGTISLLHSSSSVRGYLRAVKDLVTVVQLPETCYNEAEHSEYQKTPYGTVTHPAELIRNSQGDYFAYESGREGLLLMWNTQLPLHEASRRLRNIYDSPILYDGEPNSVVIADSPARRNDREGGGHEPPVEITAQQAMGIISDEGTSTRVQLARVALQDVEFAWLAPHRPFDDLDIVTAEIQIFGNPLDLKKARLAAEATGPERLFADAGVTIDVRRPGRRVLKHF